MARTNGGKARPAGETSLSHLTAFDAGVGIENLRGAIISHEQLFVLAPLLAAELGLDVRGD